MNNSQPSASGPASASAHDAGWIVYPRIPDGIGGVWEIEKWECHKPQCAQRNDILDGGRAWIHNLPEQCSNPKCNHLRCQDCYDVDEGDYRLQHCDGAIIFNLFNEAETWEHLEYMPRSLDDGIQRVTWKCPYWAQTGCSKLFLKSTHAARHAQGHRPVLCIPCSFEGCHRTFKQEEDKEKHYATHAKPVAPVMGKFRRVVPGSSK